MNHSQSELIKEIRLFILITKLNPALQFLKNFVKKNLALEHKLTRGYFYTIYQIYLLTHHFPSMPPLHVQTSKANASYIFLSFPFPFSPKTSRDRGPSFISGLARRRLESELIWLSSPNYIERDGRIIIIIVTGRKGRMSTDFKSIPLIGTSSLNSIHRMRTRIDPTTFNWNAFLILVSRCRTPFGKVRWSQYGWRSGRGWSCQAVGSGL